ncbi:hypothetical protein FHX44_11800 [Pseudonocardia hierapolitana]|uniref:MFS transporter n=1 Tax=Pseudonocardia hierapolitana TaxID=1128676 RepID=A0A561SJ52_9PSEU|nr:hypothetical protein [Pseudonocardia hierapolitana]TWF74917.1 hypothetical protein FHX44_11800 [Pseudonocardia hierapolitana]
MYSGYFVGGILTALVGLLLLPHIGFRAMYAIGALPLVLVLPVAWRYLPESVAFLVARGRHDEARSLADRYGLAIDDVVPAAVPKLEEADRLAGIRMIFQRTYLLAPLLFAVASFCRPAARLRAEHEQGGCARSGPGGPGPPDPVAEPGGAGARRSELLVHRVGLG